jgi:hypothetical protein
MKKAIYSIATWIKSLIAKKSEIKKELPAKTIDNSDEAKKQIIKEFNEDRMKREGFSKVLSYSYKKTDSKNLFPNEVISETIHPIANRKERFSISHKKVVKIESIDTLFYLTEKQFMFYSVIKELTQEFGKAKAKDICIRYVGELNKNIPDMEIAEWMYKLSAHNKTMKFLLKSGLVIKLSKGYKAIK